MEEKVVLGLVAILIAAISIVPYIYNIVRGKTKPHAFSWFIWLIMTSQAFLAQLISNGGAGAWVMAFTALANLGILILALLYGEKNITRSDKISFIFALTAIVPWLLTRDPTISVILIVLIDFGGFYPTIRKSYNKPFEETAFTFFLSGIKWVPSVLALSSFTLVTALYPLYLLVANLSFVAFVMIRRYQLDPAE